MILWSVYSVDVGCQGVDRSIDLVHFALADLEWGASVTCPGTQVDTPASCSPRQGKSITWSQAVPSWTSMSFTEFAFDSLLARFECRVGLPCCQCLRKRSERGGSPSGVRGHWIHLFTLFEGYIQVVFTPVSLGLVFWRWVVYLYSGHFFVGWRYTITRS